MKYYYNKITTEYAGTSAPHGENFSFTHVAPPLTEFDESAMWDGEKWGILKAEKDMKPVIDNLKYELSQIKLDMFFNFQMGRDNTELIARAKEIEDELKDYDKS